MARRAAIVTSFAALFMSGLLLAAFGSEQQAPHGV
jgi:hypothetical protein